MLSRLTGIVFALLLVVGVPALSFMTARRSDIRLVPRLALYVSAVISQWALALLGVVAVLAGTASFSAIGFRAVPAAAFLRWTVFVTLVLLAGLGIVMILEHFGWWPAESELVYLLLPDTRRERIWSVLALAPTAACCEEFLYRGYLLAQLAHWLPSVSWGWAVSSVAFGLAHAYQGWSGMLRAGLMGALLAYPVMRLGSLYPSMAAHFLIDALALAWLGPRFLRRTPPP